jgi:hypothetical protein
VRGYWLRYCAIHRRFGDHHVWYLRGGRLNGWPGYHLPR